ncbi:MAG: hypothetical protein ACE5HD_09585 [Acidobacteriota bacterium]
MHLDRQTVLLGILAVVGSLALYMSYGPARGVSLTAEEKAAEKEVDLGDLPPAIRSLLAGEEREPFNPSGGRNLFAYARPKPVAPPPKPRPKRTTRPKQPKVQVVKEPNKKPPRAPKPVLQEVPRATPPPVNFDFVGYVGPQKGLIGIFSMRTKDGDEILLAGEGEILAEKFRVHKIGYEEVEIGYTDDTFKNERKILPMGGPS